MKATGIKNHRHFLPVFFLVAALGFCSISLCRAGGSFAGGDGLSPEILVGLFTGKSVTVSSENIWQVVAQGGSTGAIQPGSAITFRAVGNRIVADGLGPEAASLLEEMRGTAVLSPVDPASDKASFVIRKAAGSSLSVDGRLFRGRLVVMASQGTLVVANQIDIESYVGSVVSSEMPGDWPLEALKAQAVAARTFAAYKTGITRLGHWGREMDLTGLKPESIRIWATDQIYRGLSGEKPDAIKATALTCGQILTFEGAPIAAFFHADAGGVTEDSGYVWGGGAAYLRGVREVPYESPYSSWQASFGETALTDLLQKFGLSGSLEAVYGHTPGISGRWFRVCVRSGEELLDLKGNDLRLALGHNVVRSLLFSSYVTGGNLPSTAVLNPELEARAVSESGQAAVIPGTCCILGKAGPRPAGRSPLFVVSGIEASGQKTVTFKGRGWGHGVGLSQWGAAAMAGSGTGHSHVLLHYYPGTTLETWW